MDFNIDQLRELIAILNQTDITELTLESGDLRLNIRKNETKAVATTSQPAQPDLSTNVVASLPVAATPIPESPPPKNLVDITSPMVGTFYRSPAPDEEPFVETGDNVRKGQSVCIIEAMKLMNEIESEVSGRIVEILVDNAQPIEYGQVLMRVEPML